MSTTVDHTKRRALGKGLESLLPRVASPAPPVAKESVPEPAQESGKPREIAVELIDKNPFQTRSHFDEQQLAELAAPLQRRVSCNRCFFVPCRTGAFN